MAVFHIHFSPHPPPLPSSKYLDQDHNGALSEADMFRLPIHNAAARHTTDDFYQITPQIGFGEVLIDTPRGVDNDDLCNCSAEEFKALLSEYKEYVLLFEAYRNIGIIAT